MENKRSNEKSDLLKMLIIRNILQIFSKLTQALRIFDMLSDIMHMPNSMCQIKVSLSLFKETFSSFKKH